MLTSTTSSSSKVPDHDCASWLRMRYSDIILKAQQYMKQQANEKDREVARIELEADVMKKQRTREKEREVSRIELEAEVTKKQQARKREREAACNELKVEVTKKQRGQVPDVDRASWLKTRYSDILLKTQQYKLEVESMKNPQTKKQEREFGRRIELEAEVTKKQQARKREREAASNELKVEVTKKIRGQVPNVELLKNPQTREQEREIGRRIKLEAEVMKKPWARKKERDAARVKLSKMAKTVDLEESSWSV